MTKNEMETFRQPLLKLERTFKDDAGELADEAFHESDAMAVDNLSNIPVEDRAELGADENSEDATIGLFENTNARLAAINAALERIDAGTFGSCEECGHDIGRDRLQSVPYSRQCIDCARKAQQPEPASPGNL
jgi:RNA polymerase-binding transcription factor DksA